MAACVYIYDRGGQRKRKQPRTPYVSRASHASAAAPVEGRRWTRVCGSWVGAVDLTNPEPAVAAADRAHASPDVRPMAARHVVLFEPAAPLRACYELLRVCVT
jgi:hypothetical protein